MGMLKKWWEKRKKTILTFGILGLILAVCWCCYYVGYQHVKGKNSLVTRINLLFGSDGEEIVVSDKERKENMITFLIAGQDQFQELDAFMIGVFDKKNLSLHFLSVPKNTLVDNNDNQKQLCKVYAKEGMTGVRKELKRLTGLPIDRYVLIRYEGFMELVDEMGGVTINVAQKMEYRDESQDLTIDLKQGEQVLNGKEALHYLRYCGYGDGELGRVRAQREFIKVFAKQAVETISRPKELAQLAAETVETDCSAKELIWLAKLGLQIDLQQDMSLEVIPGLNADFLESTYYIVNESAALGMINAKLNPYQKSIATLDLSEIGQNLFEGWQWNSDISSGFSSELETEGLDNPTRFCEYYYEYRNDAVEDSLFADAMDTPDQTRRTETTGGDRSLGPVVTATPSPAESSSLLPSIQPVIPKTEEHDIVFDPNSNQNPADGGSDSDQKEYWTPQPETNATPSAEPAETPEPPPMVELTPDTEPESGSADE